MTLVATGINYWPLRAVTGGNEGFSGAGITVGFDSATDRVGWLGNCQYTDTLTTIYIRTGTVTTGCDIDVRVESVSNGRPSGSLLAANTNAIVTVANADDNVWKTATLTAAASLTAGDLFAIVIVVSSGTPNMNFVGHHIAVTGFAGQIPILLQDTGAGTWAAMGTDAFCMFVKLGTAGVVAQPGLTSMQQTGTLQVFTSGSSPNEYAQMFESTVPRRAIGVSIMLCNIATTGTLTVALWPASSTTDSDALGKVDIDTDTFIVNTADGYVDIFFPAPVDIAANTVYYIGVRANSATNVSVAIYTTPSGITDSHLASYVQSADIHLATRTWAAGTAGAWTNTGAVENQIMLSSLIFDRLDDGTGAGSAGAPLSRVFTGM